MAKRPHNRWESPPFYKAEAKTYTGPWNVWLEPEQVTKYAKKVLVRMGEEPVNILLHSEDNYHEADDDSIRLAAYNFSLIDLCHELAHVVHGRNVDREPADWHNVTAWNLVALVTCIMSDVLDGKRK